DIIGDHTGAVNPLLGNPATDTVNSTGGYMAVINSSYKPGITFLDTINNLCPNTYYQYSAWFRNICSRCACDSNGKPPTSAGYIPTGPGDSSGVHPNLTFNVNGYDYTVRFKITSFFKNYTERKLEKSINGGATWVSPGIDTLGMAPTGSATM